MKLLLFVSIFFFTTHVSSAQDSLSLSRAIDSALEHNFNVQISEIESEKAQARVTRGNAGQMPSLSVTGELRGSYTDVEMVPGSFFQKFLDQGAEQAEGSLPEITFDGVRAVDFNSGLETQFMIYDGMKGRLRYKRLASGSILADLQHHSEMENTVMSVTRQYLQAVSLQKAVGLKELSLEQSRDRYHTMEARHEYGQSSIQERLQALADLKSDSTGYRNLKNQYESAWRDLQTMIGWEHRERIPLSEETKLAGSFTYEELRKSLTENNTALHMMQRRIEHAEIEEGLIRADVMPTVMASAQYGYNYHSSSDGQFETQKQLGLTGGVSIKIPIFSGGRNRIASQNAKATIRQEQLRYEESEREIRTRFENLWHQYKHLEYQFDTEKSNLEIYERNNERARDSFERGLISGVELRAAQLSFEDARLRLADTRFQMKLVESTLLYLTGNLIQ